MARNISASIGITTTAIQAPWMNPVRIKTVIGTAVWVWRAIGGAFRGDGGRGDHGSLNGAGANVAIYEAEPLVPLPPKPLDSQNSCIYNQRERGGFNGA
jgi:hypothetical protein